jgi:hypothetical protein
MGRLGLMAGQALQHEKPSASNLKLVCRGLITRRTGKPVNLALTPARAGGSGAWTVSVGEDAVVELRVVADRLYGLRPGEFTEVRDAEAAAAKAAGDAALATAIRALRKPSMSAWGVNALVRQAPGELDDLLAIGADLRAAQQGAAGDEVRRLSRERRRLTGALLGVAGDLAAEQGHQLSAAVARDIGATLDAAVADVGAAAALRSGRLVRALAPGGFDAVDLDGAVAVPGELPASGELPAVPARARLRVVQTSTLGPDRRATAAHRALEAALEAARESAAVAERAVTKANSALDSAAAKAEAARSGVEEAERARTAAHDQLARADAARDAAGGERDAAARVRDQARRAVERAEAALKHGR